MFAFRELSTFRETDFAKFKSVTISQHHKRQHHLQKHCICTWYWETKNSAAKECRNIRRLSGPFKRIYKKTAYLWKKEQLF